jgi:selenocysteine-specific elongation factor
MRHLIVGTAGHIDHGKSALVEALTGTHPDRLAEEQRRGITIELGFADVDLGEGRALSLVDVPGHERFVRHMVAGAAGIDAVLLVVAADEGVKPQTLEHLAICRLLDVKEGIVALTKTDLVGAELAEVVELEVRETLAGSFLESAPLVRTSARTGEGLPALRQALLALFDRVPARRVQGSARLPVDRSFVLRGFGTVVTGTLYAGALFEGQEVEVLPGGRRARIRGLQVHGRGTSEVAAGHRVAVNLQGVDCDDVPRGSTLCAPGGLVTTRRIWAQVAFLPGAPAALVRKGGVVRFHQGTCERWARLRVSPGGEGAAGAELVLDAETVLLPGDRFILRRPRPLDTVGGGRVVDAQPPAGAFRRRARGGAFGALNETDPVGSRVERAGDAGIAVSELAASLGRSEEEVLREAERSREGGPVRVGGRLFARRDWERIGRAVVAAVGTFHEEHPLLTGVRREDLRGRLAAAMPQDAWRALLEALARGGEVRLEGDLLAHAGHRVVLSGDDLDVAERVEARFRDAGLEPPDAEGVVREIGGTRTRRIVEVLVERGRLVRIVDGRLFHADALISLRRRLAEHARTSKTIDVAQFKALTGVTRKNAIPLLEQMDAERITRRTGNVREILTDTAA